MAMFHNPTTVRDVPDAYRWIYTHAVECRTPERLLFVSGQIGVTKDGTTLASFDDQCRQAMDNVEAILGAAGMTPADMVHVTYFVTDTEDLKTLRQARIARWSQIEPPAVTTLVVAGLASPDLRVEIEVTAVR